jgi:nitrogen fixation NifU-like protein
MTDHSDDLYDLYQDLILDHNRRPRNRRALPDHDRAAEGYNPLCGDRVKIYLKVDGDVIRDAAFEGAGCAISTASASLMTETVKGKTLDEARALFDRFHHLLTREADNGPDDPTMGKLAAFSGVRKYPARVKCATLAWHTVNAALENRHDVVSTED